MQRSWVALLALLSLVALGNAPNLFRRGPAQMAVAEPCRYMGTFHKETRNRIEALRMCGAITDEEWRCMVEALEAVDSAFTERCEGAPVAFAEIATDQKLRYAGCLDASHAAAGECAILTTEPSCFRAVCR